ncbi:NifB/NifX family molybdenum-iron cluster-binding protein [Metallumcola ferriviriculae]|uniref:NifB/NifX family molybdenum-iron cluster-binding protein n=1 Tax=Metallumcola ferriviriculae TaxID=3039180 RepID=A0AAU0URM2_9FIRM|nr:NifB/NifX family molybdenum-iron cluster-binding protein [Desulfitibacteraceae bacterium MK1]
MKKRIAVPSETPGGLGASRSAHFGHCDVFTMVDIEDGEIKDVSVLPNSDHEHGGCLAPVKALLLNGVRAMVVGGMGPNPLAGFQAAGISVYLGSGDTVKDAVQAFVDNSAPRMDNNSTCGCGGHGHDHEHEHGHCHG